MRDEELVSMPHQPDDFHLTAQPDGESEENPGILEVRMSRYGDPEIIPVSHYLSISLTRLSKSNLSHNPFYTAGIFT